MDSRTKKIQLLKGLLKGTRKIDEVLPFQPIMFFHHDDLEPDVYTCKGKTYTREQVDKFGKNPRIHVIIFNSTCETLDEANQHRDNLENLE